MHEASCLLEMLAFKPLRVVNLHLSCTVKTCSLVRLTLLLYYLYLFIYLLLRNLRSNFISKCLMMKYVPYSSTLPGKMMNWIHTLMLSKNNWTWSMQDFRRLLLCHKNVRFFNGIINNSSRQYSFDLLQGGLLILYGVFPYFPIFTHCSGE